MSVMGKQALTSALPQIQVRSASIRGNYYEEHAPTYLRSHLHHQQSAFASPRVFFSEEEYSHTPFMVRVSFDSVAFVHRHTHVIERNFVFPNRVLDAVMADFHSKTPAGKSVSVASEQQQQQQQHPDDIIVAASQSADPEEPLLRPGNSTVTDGDLRRSKGLQQLSQPHLCVLVRSDCVNIYTPLGDVFEVPLPFQASQIIPISWGLLLQRSQGLQIPSTLSAKRRRSSTSSNSSSGSATRKSRFIKKQQQQTDTKLSQSQPHLFSLSHPLDEIKPLAVATDEKGFKAPTEFLTDPSLQVISFLRELSLLVAFHQQNRRFCVYHMTKVAEDRGQQQVAAVTFVDGPTWQIHREESLYDEEKVNIEPDWIVKALWSSPCIERSSSCTIGMSTIASTKSAFVASDMDRSLIVCMVDKEAGMLILKKLHGDGGRVTSREGLRIVHCCDAVPVSLLSNAENDDCLPAPNADADDIRDIVILKKSGQLELYRADHPICELILPGDRTYRSSWSSEAMKIQLKAHSTASYYEILFGDSRDINSRKVWRCNHPLRLMCSPLLEQVFKVVECVLSASSYLALRARVICISQQNAIQAKAIPIDCDFDPVTKGGYEWDAFREYVLTSDTPIVAQTGIRAGSGPSVSVDSEKTISAFERLCQSSFHQVYQYDNSALLARLKMPAFTPSVELEPGYLQSRAKEKIDRSAIQDRILDVFAALHLLYQDLKLSVISSRFCQSLADLLLSMSSQLKLYEYTAYYQHESCLAGYSVAQDIQDLSNKGRKYPRLYLDVERGVVPDIFEWIHSKIRAAGASSQPNLQEFPMLTELMPFTTSAKQESILWRTRAICHIYGELLVDLHASSPTQSTPDCDGQTALMLNELMTYLTRDRVGSALDLEDLPAGIAYPIAQAIRTFRHAPPPSVTEDVCEFIGREDLIGMAALGDAGVIVDTLYSSQNGGLQKESRDSSTDSIKKSTEDVSDGLEETLRRSQRLFPTDQRMKEVARLVRSNRPLCLKLEKTLDISDQDFVQLQQSRLLLLCKRSMALPVARGMVTLGNFDLCLAQNQAWQLRAPGLPLAGRTPPTNAIVTLDVSGYAKELTYWPQFHNGCAAGLRLPARDLSSVVNRYWIKYHRPSVAEHQQRADGRTNGQVPPPDPSKRSLEEAHAAHAGLLLGLGLQGHLKCLSMADVYNYLSISNEFVTVAILLGMASTAAHCRRQRQRQLKIGTQNEVSGRSSPSTKTSTGDNDNQSMPNVKEDEDALFRDPTKMPSMAPFAGMGLELTLERSVSKMLCLHIPSLLPPPFAEFSVPASAQTAAFLGLGILYQSSGHRLMTELLLTEIARSPSSPQFVTNNGNSGLSTAAFDQLEGYALAAGFALGLVILGRGQATTGDPGLADLKLEEKLHKYIVGGAQQYGDMNSVGSCVYRGRRWTAFGSSASFSSDVSANRESPAATTSGPGTSRDSKFHADRGGRGEHVNTGVTACGSALALAFMYMQTGNKSIASQLAVPDTLILLDYVRPDILLVRTLARNLVLWDEIQPTVEWIEETEVPQQLLRAYASVQQENSTLQQQADNVLPTYVDVQSICETYANIVAGACFSMGLRYAGSADVIARTTLTKYLLHFRDMRVKSTTMLKNSGRNTVAGNTDRVTIERCLSVCAQALALVDAGTGNIDTLRLLRSVNLRQRVDSELTYGNHMALSMAIGLLFLGGGRATVSRSKEAIAALIISMYPMYPLNTADNKYHLQAFRHMYVLAVDTSRLLETIDVNSKANCSVEVRLHMQKRPGVIGTDQEWRVMKTPCLLPELHSIRRIVVSSSGYYPVEIVMPSKTLSTCAEGSDSTHRTANELRIQQLCENNVILLKRRYHKDPIGSLSGFSDKLQQLHQLAAVVTGCSDAQERLLSTFSSYFLHGTSMDNAVDDTSDISTYSRSLEIWWERQCQQVLCQNVQDEAHSMLPLHLNVLHGLFRIQHLPLRSRVDLWNIKLYSEFALRSHIQCYGDRSQANLCESDSGKSRSKSATDDQSISDFVIWLKHQTEEALRLRWRRSSIAVTGSIDQASIEENFLLHAIVGYFRNPMLDSNPAHGKAWMQKLQQILVIASTSQSSQEFKLNELLASKSTLVDEKTWWLQLVSFFIFAV